MGTRADFYIGRGQQAEWLGSVAWDGYQWHEEDGPLMQAKTPDEFRETVASIAKQRDDFTSPADGWPWPWDDSRTTDYAYVLHDGKVTAYIFGGEAFLDEEGCVDARDEKADWFPNMASRKAMAPPGSKRSGVMLISG